MAECVPRLFYGTEEAVAKLAAALKRQAAILAAVRLELMKLQQKTTASLVPMIWMIQKTCGSVFFLAEKEQSIGVILVSRAALEGTINALYICAIGPDASDKALRHAMQKSYRDITQIRNFHKEYLDDNGNDLADFEPSEALQKVIEEFSTKRGKELPYWTPDSLHDRIDLVEERIGPRAAKILRIAVSAIYRQSSEIVHGTLYGALHAMHQVPIQRQIASADEMQTHNRQEISTVVFLIICLLDQLVAGIVKEYHVSDRSEDTRSTIEAIRNEIIFENEA